MVREHNTENTALTLIWLVVILTFFCLAYLAYNTFKFQRLFPILIELIVNDRNLQYHTGLLLPLFCLFRLWDWKKNQSAKCDITLPSLSDCVCVSRPPHPFPLIFGMRTDPLCSCTQQLSGLNSSAHTKTFLALLRHLLHLMGSFRLRVAW